MENLDLLFAQVGEISTHQQKMAGQFDVSTKVVEQLLLDQQILAKQIEATGQAVARLNLNQSSAGERRSSSPTSSDTSMEPPPPHRRHFPAGTSRHHTRHADSGFPRHSHEEGGPIRAVLLN
jgi:hypothetical protein